VQPGQPAGNFFDPDNLAAAPPPDKPLAKDGRSSREALIAITNSYFDGITSHDGSIIIAHPGCNRVENGFTVTNRAGGPGGGGDCAANLGNINVQLVAARRYPIVDEEAGVVLAIAIFIRKPGTTTRRNVLSEWFTIENNRIRTIHSAMFYPPPEAPAPNWPPYDGNWPLPPTLALSGAQVTIPVCRMFRIEMRRSLSNERNRRSQGEFSCRRWSPMTIG
jgi:hypothetical protein